MPFEEDARYRTTLGDRSKDGFIDHVARRGVEKGAGVLSWCLFIVLGLIVLSAVMQVLGLS